MTRSRAIQTSRNSMPVIYQVSRLTRAVRHASYKMCGVSKTVGKRFFVGLVSGSLVFPVYPVMADNLPTGGVVVGGGATITDGLIENTNITTIDQTADRVRIDWGSFNIANGYEVNFNQNSEQVAINLVNESGGLSTIAGDLNAGGHIVLVNPSGITFADGATISVNSLVASTLSFSDDQLDDSGSALNQFLSSTRNNLEFDKNQSGEIINNVGITAASSIVMLSSNISNNSDALISADYVYLGGSGDGATVTFAGERFGVEVTSIDGGNSHDINITNSGIIEGHEIYLTAAQVDRTLESAVNNKGTIKATELELDTSGNIYLAGNEVSLSAGSSINSDVGLTSSSLHIGGESNPVNKLTIEADASVSTSNNTAYTTNLDYTQNSADDSVALTGASGEVLARNITVKELSSVKLNEGTLTGTAGSDTFKITGKNALRSQEIAFSGVGAVDGGANTSGDGDKVTAVADGTATLVASDTSDMAEGNSLSTSDIDFSNIEVADLNGGTLSGSTDNDSFTVSDTGALTANGIMVNNVTGTIDAQGDTSGDSLTGSNLTLTGGLLGVQAGTDDESVQYTFTNINTATASDHELTGTSGSDSFELVSDHTVDAAGIRFSDVNKVDGGGNTSGDGDKITAVADGTSTLVASDTSDTAEGNSLSTSEIDFSNIEVANLNGGTLSGSADNDSFTVSDTGALTANGIKINNVTGSINAKGSVADTSGDSLTGSNLTLTGGLLGVQAGTNDESVQYTFTNINTATAADNTLTGSTGSDTFNVSETAGVVTIEGNGVDFTDVASVDGDAAIGDNSSAIDQVNTDAASLTDTDKQLSTHEILFSNIEQADLNSGSLQATASTTSFNLTGDARGLFVREMTVNNVASVEGASSGATVTGSSGDDTFVVGSDGGLTANDIRIDGPVTIDGAGNTDTLISELADAVWDITAEGAGTLNNYIFSSFENLVNSAGDLNLTTALAGVFAGDSITLGTGTQLSFNSGNNVTVNSSFSGDTSLSGNVNADFLDITTADDVVLDTNINGINIARQSGTSSVDITIEQSGNLVLRQINAGAGVVTLTSAVNGQGTVSAETVNDTNIIAREAYIGTDASDSDDNQWGAIGENFRQLTFDVTDILRMKAVTYVTPLFRNQVPDFDAEGNESESLVSSQSGSFVIKDTVGNLVEIDPAIFEGVTPFVADASAVAGDDGEYRIADNSSSLDTSTVAMLLASYEATASGDAPEDEYEVEGESELVADDDQDIQVAISEDGQVLGVVKDYVFRAGDSLWSLSQRFLGNGSLWQTLVNQNPSIKDPSNISDGSLIKVVVKVSEEVADKIRAAIESGKGTSNGRGTVLPASLREQIDLP